MNQDFDSLFTDAGTLDNMTTQVKFDGGGIRRDWTASGTIRATASSCTAAACWT